MYKQIGFILLNGLLCAGSYAQDALQVSLKNSDNGYDSPQKIRFIATSSLLDAALNSINSINGLVKKENYRNKITSFNNPANADMGFSLEAEITLALKPMLEKATQAHAKKFPEVISSLLTPGKNQLSALFPAVNVFHSLVSMVGSFAMNEKKISRQDVDSFVLRIGKYFDHYEKLKSANLSFDAAIDKFNNKLQELQFDTREFMLDLITILHPAADRRSIRQKSLEELLLKYLDKEILDTVLDRRSLRSAASPHYPGDGLKTCKEIVYGIQKLFEEYQKIYAANYRDIRVILLQTKELGKNINMRQADTAIAELDQLYSESKEADVLNLRLSTLAERLRFLVNTEGLTESK